MIINRVSSLPPGARKYVDIGRVTNNLIVDIGKFYYYVLFRFHMIVIFFQPHVYSSACAALAGILLFPDH